MNESINQSLNQSITPRLDAPGELGLARVLHLLELVLQFLLLLAQPEDGLLVLLHQLLQVALRVALVLEADHHLLRAQMSL
jgi:hypothetical protein